MTLLGNFNQAMHCKKEHKDKVVFVLIDKMSSLDTIRRHLLTACSSANPFLALKDYCQDLLKTDSEKSALNGQGYIFD